MTARDMSLIFVLNGPNLNLLGKREPAVYGSATLDDIEKATAARAEKFGLKTEFRQSNHEGALIDMVQEAMQRAAALIVNPGGLTHSSVSLRDAIAATALPTIEVHLSNIFAREEFRHKSHVSGVAIGVISGLGAIGYELAVEALSQHLKR